MTGSALTLAIDVSISADLLDALLRELPIASIRITPQKDRPLTAQDVLPLVAASQDRDVAVLLTDDAAVARIVRADGVHLTRCRDPLAVYGEARDILGKRAIVGAEPDATRHQAMELGEAGADYIAFAAASCDRQLDGSHDQRADQGSDWLQELWLERIAWWTEIFEIPCLALPIIDSALAHAVFRSGADFAEVPVTAGASMQAEVARIKLLHNALSGVVDAAGVPA
ncbi:MAG: thiamine phosphate synthase [Hyphomicrobiaceae bacterium]